MSGLLHSPAEIIRKLLVDLGTGAEPPALPWPVYASYAPADPDELVVVFDTTARSHGRTMPDGERQQHYGIRILIRSGTHRSGYARTALIQGVLDGLYQRPVGLDEATYLVHSVNRSDEATTTGKNYPSSARSLFTINATTALTRTT